MSWLPPVEEWPARAVGIRVSRASGNATSVHVQRSVIRATTAHIRANSAVQSQDRASATWPTAVISRSTDTTSDIAKPVVSETVNGTISSAHTIHTIAPTAADRSAR